MHWLRVSRHGTELHHFVVALVAIKIGRVTGTTRIAGASRVGRCRRGTCSVRHLVSGHEAVVTVGREAHVARGGFGRHGEGSSGVSRLENRGWWQRVNRKATGGSSGVVDDDDEPCPSGDTAMAGVVEFGGCPQSAIVPTQAPSPRTYCCC